MKHLLLTIIAAVLLVGCGESQSPEPPTAKAPDISIHDAAKKGNLEVIKEHLSAGVDIHSKDERMGSTPLHFAVMYSRRDAISLLISEGADVNAKNKYGDTPLHKSSDFVVELLIEKGADINARNNRDETPLHQEAVDRMNKNAKIPKIVLLIDKGADLEAKNKRGMTPLHCALAWGINSARGGANKNIELLIAKGADVNAKNNLDQTLLHTAAIHGRMDFLELLIAKGADVNAKDTQSKTPLDWAKKTKIEELLRKHGGKTGEELPPATLREALIRDDLQGIKDFLAKGADVNARMRNGNTLLDWAISRKPTETADLLRKHGGKTGEELKTAGPVAEAAQPLPPLTKTQRISIHHAAGAANIEVVKQHIAAGTDVDARDSQDKTPLQHAAYWGHQEIAELLIAKGADVNAKDEAGKTSLDWTMFKMDDFPLKGKAAKKGIADLIRKHGGKTGEELKAEGK